MAQEPIEVILVRHWASYIATPIWISDPGGNLIFYNEPAEPILGRRFDEAGEVHAADLAELFVTTDLDGTPLPAAELPLVVALERRIPAHRALRVRSLDGTWRVIDVTSIPLVGQGGRHLGALAAFWERE